MASPPILHGGPSTSADAASISSALGVGENLSIRIDPTMREEAAPRVAVDRGAATDAPAIHITIQHLAPAVDVGPSTRAPGGNRSHPSGLRNDHGRNNDSSSSSGGGSGSDAVGREEAVEKKKLKAEMRGVFDILLFIMTAVVPLALLVYTLLPHDNPAAHRDAWISLGIVVSLAAIGAVIARFAVTNTAAEVSSSIGLLASMVLIMISWVVVAEVLPYEIWSWYFETFICICLLLADFCAWIECAQRPKYLASCVTSFKSFMALIGLCDKGQISRQDSGHQRQNLLQKWGLL